MVRRGVTSYPASAESRAERAHDADRVKLTWTVSVLASPAKARTALIRCTNRREGRLSAIHAMFILSLNCQFEVAGVSPEISSAHPFPLHTTEQYARYNAASSARGIVVSVPDKSTRSERPSCR